MKKSFYISDFYYIKSVEEFNSEKIPPLIRRKLSPIDKLAVEVISQVYNNNVEEIVFSSKQGEITRLEKIIEQYNELNEVSPAQFSGSVHNFAVGFFTLFQKINIPYYAISSGENSLSAGFIKSIISQKNNSLFCYVDSSAVACLISNEFGKIKCEFENSCQKNSDEFNSFVDFLEGKIDIYKSNFGIIRKIEG